MLKHGSVILYVHGNQNACWDLDSDTAPEVASSAKVSIVRCILNRCQTWSLDHSVPGDSSAKDGVVGCILNRLHIISEGKTVFSRLSGIRLFKG